MKICLKPLHKTLARSIICCLLTTGVTADLFAQSGETTISQQFDSYRKTVLQEKMFVHTDKDFYLAGEICWFKIYTVDGFFHRPLDVSKVAYAELLDNNNKPVVQAKIALENGTGNGSVYVPVAIESGTYQLRVYSNWMKNFSPAYFFHKTITVVNTQQVTELTAIKSKAAYDVQFFPEGGNLVNGLQSKIAFKVVDQNGIGVDCNAEVINDQQETVAKFKATKFGMGHFTLTPAAHRHYTAVVTMPDGIKVNKELPAAYNNGYVMSLVEDGEKMLKVMVQSAGDSNSASSSLYLFAHSRGSVKEAMNGTTQNNTAIFLIDKNKLGDGISNITIFNSDRKPVCERLYFKYPAQKVLLRILPDKAEYGLRQKININVAAVDQYANPLATDMSMSVYRVDSLQTLVESGISEWLWLSSDLPGNVESPDYYFNGKGTEVSEAMDNLMLTNGWRRFKWEDVLKNKQPVFAFVPEHNGHIITGRVINGQTGAPAVHINTFLSVPGTTRFRTSQSDEKGNLKFEIKNFYGTPGIVVQTNGEKDSGYRVEIDNPFFNQYTPAQTLPFLMSAVNPATLLDHSIGMQVENIYNGDTLRKVKDGSIDTSSFYQHANAIYLLDNYVRFTTMEEVLREYVFPVNVRKRGNKFHLPVYNDADKFNGLFDRDPLVLLDGVPVFDMDKVIQYDPLKVRKLEAVTRRYYYGQLTFDGVVNLVTYSGDLPGYELDPHATVIDYDALQLQREFYSPVYETAQQAANHRPDFRNVLNWSPEIKTGADGKYQQQFYSSDIPGKYVIVMQALTKDGKTGSNWTYFEVKKPLK